MDKQHKCLIAIGAAITAGIAAALIDSESKSMKYAVKPGGFCPACGNPVFDNRRRCGSCGERLIWRKEK